MYSLMYAAFGLGQAVIFFWLLRVYRETGVKAAALLLLPQFFMIWDNFRIASGVLVGFGDLLYALSWPAYWSHWLTGSWLIVACGSVLRLADFEFARSRWAIGAFCLITTLLMAHDLRLFWTESLYPVCDFDLLRYARSVNELTRCSPEQPLVAAKFPMAPVLTAFIVIVTGLLLWVRRGFPWMAVGGILMFLAGGIPVLARHRLENLGEVLIVAGVIFAIRFFAAKNYQGLRSSPQGV